ncbi:HET-domain-containing protein [Plenodomus tracheiphilus IPT5]|uniref:HET-domain-containing protein n=1 Tax=Plenodomus tracheiphilus IPT5 TaxID=1408161 RepID=A0A6A7BHM2_9PLEO|nr:HET-domain-containing protein [Plenodomus tracheiphilus IPT5]
MSYLSPYYRAAARQMQNGVEGGDLCVPCRKAFQEDDRGGFADIGTAAWLNDGYEDQEHLTEPLLYCCCCRHVLRASEYARRRGKVYEQPTTMQPAWDFDGLTTSTFLHDDGLDVEKDQEALLKDYKVVKPDYSRTIQHHWADIPMIKSWLSDCEQSHGDSCNKHRTSNAETEEILLVDVVNDCLTVATYEQYYFALSYVWGASKQFLTLTDNYEELCRPGSLSAQPLTQTIRDSMSFVKSLGERYLWIDTVCIVQNDTPKKAKAIAQMCSIYSKAVATIISLSGASADAGLSGIPPTARNTTAMYVCPGLHITQRSILDQMMKTYNYDSEDCVYNSRAWTFQERLLSNRSIIFVDEQVYFHCKQHLVCEDRCEKDETDFYTLENMRESSTRLRSKAQTYSPLNEFRWYEQIVVEYTTKRMGKPDDIINAFTGVQTELSNMFNWNFTAGLPTPLLDLALLWTPITNIQRRRLATSQQPSWSWSGWFGRTRYTDLIRPGHRPIGPLFKPLGIKTLRTPNDLILNCMSTNLTPHFHLLQTPKSLLDPFGTSLISPDSYYIFDEQRRRCGILIGCSEDQIKGSTQHDLQLVQLSAWKSNNSLTIYGPLVAQLQEDGNRVEERLFDAYFEDRGWCTFNVLLVRLVDGGVYERVAVGQVHVDAWVRAGETAKTFTVR